MDGPFVYDKAKYHSEAIEKAGLPEGQEFVHTGFYFGWLIDNDMLDHDFVKEFIENEFKEFKERKITGPEVYSWCDGALIDDMLSDEGNEFSRLYFDFKNGDFLTDYQKAFSVSGGLDIYGVKDTWENYEKLKVFIDRRYSKWKAKKNKKPWEFWK